MIRAKAILLVGLVATSLVVQSIRLEHASTSAEAATAATRALVSEASEVLRLRGARATTATQELPTSDLLALVNQVMSEAGLPSRHLERLEPQGVVATEHRGLKRQTARLALTTISVDDLGRVLAGLARTQSLLKPTSIELTHQDQAGDRHGTWNVTLVLAAPYRVED
jgi:hypothetical protein